MKIIRYDNKYENMKNPTIFLAGPTVRGNQPHLKSWRHEAIRLFRVGKFDGTLIVPEWLNKTATDKGWENVLVPWEFTGLSMADCIMFWIPRTRELIGLTTNHEFGYWLAKERTKMIYGRPNIAYRMGYLDTMWNLDRSDVGKSPSGTSLKDNRKIYTTLAETVSAAQFLANKRWKDRHWDTTSSH